MGHLYNIALALPDDVLTDLEAHNEDALLRLANAITSSVLAAKDQLDFEKRLQGRKLGEYLRENGQMPEGILYLQVIDRAHDQDHDWGVSSGMIGHYRKLEVKD